MTDTYGQDKATCERFLHNFTLMQTPQGRIKLIEWCETSGAPQKQINFWAERIRKKEASEGYG